MAVWREAREHHAQAGAPRRRHRCLRVGRYIWRVDPQADAPDVHVYTVQSQGLVVERHSYVGRSHSWSVVTTPGPADAQVYAVGVNACRLAVRVYRAGLRAYRPSAHTYAVDAHAYAVDPHAYAVDPAWLRRRRACLRRRPRMPTP